MDSNLLRLFKRTLGLLGEDEVVFDLLEVMNKEDFSPLRGRIMIGAETVKKGYKEGQLAKILQMSKTYEKLDRLTQGDQLHMCRMLSNYLQAWERVYRVSYQSPEKDTLTKVSGLRYVFYLLPDILETLERQRKIASTENFEEIVRLLPAATGIENVFEDEELSLAFRGEGATRKLAQDHAKQLFNYCQHSHQNFNPAEGV